MQRIKYLDGLRGIAILLVILYHAYGVDGYENAFHYNHKFSAFPIFKYGFLGVELFFLISGFVILMTLEKSKNFINFIYKRWIRLFPAMLIATILSYTTVSIFYERPLGHPNICSVIPGLVFIEPTLLGKLFNYEFIKLEGSFWSLYVEMLFYIIFGLGYFIFKRRNALLFLFFLYIYAIIGLYYPLKASNLFIHFGWFTSGCLAYLYTTENRNRKYLLISIIIFAISLYSTYVFYSNTEQTFPIIEYLIFAILIIFLFFIPILFEKSRSIIGNRLFLFIGFISYPLYLIHENLLVSGITKLQKYTIIPEFLLPIFPILLLILIAYVITKKIEPFTKKLIVTIFDKIGILKYLKD